jgi:hypothetical protein
MIQEISIMPTSTQELQVFHQDAAARIQNGGAGLELDELLEEWKSRNLGAKSALSESCCVLEDEIHQARDRIVESLDRRGVTPVANSSGIMSSIAPEGESADDFLQAIGRSQDTGTRQDWMND